MASRYWFVAPHEAFLDFLPRAIVRPITSFIEYEYPTAVPSMIENIEPW
jgi:hypothetical protein